MSLETIHTIVGLIVAFLVGGIFAVVMCSMILDFDGVEGSKSDAIVAIIFVTGGLIGVWAASDTTKSPAANQSQRPVNSSKE